MKNKKRKERKSINGFTQVPNSILYDETLSIGAKGLLAEFIANPPDWKTYQREIFGRSTDGRAVHKRALDELGNRGYITMKQERNAKGHFQYIYFRNDDLIFGRKKNKTTASEQSADKPSMVEPITVNPNTVEPIADEPITENEPISNTDYLSNTELSNTDIKSNTDLIKKEEIKNSIRKEDTPVITREEKEPEIMASSTGEFISPSLAEVIQFFKFKGYDNAGAFAFFQEFEGRKWYSIKGEKVKNWKGMATHFVKTKGAIYFILPDEEKTEILTWAKDTYKEIYVNAHNKTQETGRNYLHYGSAGQIRDWLVQLATEKGICTAKELFEYVDSLEPNKETFNDFKRSLGLSDINNTGKRYV